MKWMKFGKLRGGLGWTFASGLPAEAMQNHTLMLVSFGVRQRKEVRVLLTCGLDRYKPCSELQGEKKLEQPGACAELSGGGESEF